MKRGGGGDSDGEGREGRGVMEGGGRREVVIPGCLSFVDVDAGLSSAMCACHLLVGGCCICGCLSFIHGGWLSSMGGDIIKPPWYNW